MIRFLFILISGLLVTLLFLQSRILKHNETFPLFLQSDIIAARHKTIIEIETSSLYKLGKEQLEVLKKDYSNIWAHLNHLYASNDVEAGKEYYTEEWFKQICGHYSGILKESNQRNDLQHKLSINNWSSDGLVCTGIDSDVVFTYTYSDNTQKKISATVAVVLLFQGDHWRIDALRYINEKEIN